MNIKLIYWILGTGLIFLVIITYLDTPIEQVFVIETQKLFPVLTSVATLAIAIALYDKYGYRKNIYEKKLNTVLELLAEIKALSIVVHYEHEYEEYGEISTTNINKKFTTIQHLSEKSLNAPLIYNIHEYIYGISKIISIGNSPYLPTELSKNLEFLNIRQWTKVDFKETPEYTKISFANLKPSDEYNEYWVLRKKSDNMTLKQYLFNLNEILKNVESWIDKHGGFTSDLNI